MANSHAVAVLNTDRIIAGSLVSALEASGDLDVFVSTGSRLPNLAKLKPSLLFVAAAHDPPRLDSLLADVRAAVPGVPLVICGDTGHWDRRDIERNVQVLDYLPLPPEPERLDSIVAEIRRSGSKKKVRAGSRPAHLFRSLVGNQPADPDYSKTY